MLVQMHKPKLHDITLDQTGNKLLITWKCFNLLFQLITDQPEMPDWPMPQMQSTGMMAQGILTNHLLGCPWLELWYNKQRVWAEADCCSQYKWVTSSYARARQEELLLHMTSCHMPKGNRKTNKARSLWEDHTTDWMLPGPFHSGVVRCAGCNELVWQARSSPDGDVLKMKTIILNCSGNRWRGRLSKMRST